MDHLYHPFKEAKASLLISAYAGTHFLHLGHITFVSGNG